MYFTINIVKNNSIIIRVGAPTVNRILNLAETRSVQDVEEIFIVDERNEETEVEDNFYLASQNNLKTYGVDDLDAGGHNFVIGEQRTKDETN